MKILVYSTHRTGSNNFIKWLSNELNYKSFFELEQIPHNVTDNFIVKRIPPLIQEEIEVGFEFERDYIKFDKVIVLYREDTLKQSESNVYAINKGKWRHASTLDGFYSLDEKFFNKHRRSIEIGKERFDNLKEYFKNINVKCLKLIYEEIFFDLEKIKQIEEYIGFVSKSILVNPLDKLRTDKNSMGLRKLPHNII
jgi:LPS sulfotransferase NodH